MKPGGRRLRLLVVVLAVLGCAVLLYHGIQNLFADETSGLTFVRTASFATKPDPPNESLEEYHRRRQEDWLTLLGEPRTSDLIQYPNRETYRFCYQPSFHSQVCICVWRENNQAWIRSSVLEMRSNGLWEKTKPLSDAKWARICADFQMRSVTDPLNGEQTRGGIDGSTWILQAIVPGRSTFTEISNAARSKGIPGFQIVTPREPQLDDFVGTSRLLLDWGGVQISEMY